MPTAPRKSAAAVTRSVAAVTPCDIEEAEPIGSVAPSSPAQVADNVARAAAAAAEDVKAKFKSVVHAKPGKKSPVPLIVAGAAALAAAVGAVLWSLGRNSTQPSRPLKKPGTAKAASKRASKSTAPASAKPKAKTKKSAAARPAAAPESVAASSVAASDRAQAGSDGTDSPHMPSSVHSEAGDQTAAAAATTNGEARGAAYTPPTEDEMAAAAAEAAEELASDSQASADGQAETDDESTKLTEAEQQVQMMSVQAAKAWYMQQHGPAMQMQQQAVNAAQQDDVRPDVLMQAATTLANMQLFSKQFEAAEETLELAMSAADAAGQPENVVRISTTLGEIMKNQDRIEEAKELYKQIWEVVLQEYGSASEVSSQARTNYAEALDEGGQQEEARQLLLEQCELLVEQAEAAAAEQKAAGAADTSSGGSKKGASEAPGEEGEDGEDAQAGPPPRAVAEAIIDVARLHMRHKDLEGAEERLQQGLALFSKLYGDDNIAVGGMVVMLAQCYKESGRHDAAVAEYEALLDKCVRRVGLASRTTMTMAMELCELHKEAGEFGKAAAAAEKALAGLEVAVGDVPGHPAVRKLVGDIVDLKRKAGDEAGAVAMQQDFISRLQQSPRPLPPHMQAALAGMPIPEDSEVAHDGPSTADSNGSTRGARRGGGKGRGRRS